jgi:hypothetical protein
MHDITVGGGVVCSVVLLYLEKEYTFGCCNECLCVFMVLVVVSSEFLDDTPVSDCPSLCKQILE